MCVIIAARLTRWKSQNRDCFTFLELASACFSKNTCICACDVWSIQMVWYGMAWCIKCATCCTNVGYWILCCTHKHMMNTSIYRSTHDHPHCQQKLQQQKYWQKSNKANQMIHTLFTVIDKHLFSILIKICNLDKICHTARSLHTSVDSRKKSSTPSIEFSRCCCFTMCDR